MSDDSFTEVTSTGWLSRIGKSITGVLIGLALTVGSFPLLWWNEGRSVKTYQGLVEGEKIAITVPADAVDAANDGKLVHLTGRAEAKDQVADPVFGLSTAGTIKLRRIVEMYQWVEKKTTKTKKKMGGSEERVTEYTYSKEWDDKMHDSKDFRKPGHTNPQPAYTTEVFLSKDATLGTFALPRPMIEGWGDLRPVSAAAADLALDFREKVLAQNGWFYLTGKAEPAELGDLRIKFESIPAGDASILARQVKNTFEPYTTQVGTQISRISSGVLSKEAMFAAAQAENTMITWLLRGGGLLLMFIGISLVFQPFKVFADVLPLAGKVVGAGVGIVSFLLAAIGSTLTIALAWLWYRPLLGAAVLAATVVLLVMLVRLLRKRVA
jgi:hypothetical protein